MRWAGCPSREATWENSSYLRKDPGEATYDTMVADLTAVAQKGCRCQWWRLWLSPHAAASQLADAVTDSSSANGAQLPAHGLQLFGHSVDGSL